MDDTRRAAELRHMQRLATALLGLMTTVFVVTTIFYDWAPWVPFVRAFAEAAMVGGLADWFAVTALFRHPLGIPIPHTAIIPRQRERIAEGMGRFIERNFLDPDRIVARLRQQDVAGRIARLLRNPRRSGQIADVVAESLAGLLRVVNDEEVGALLQQALVDRLEAVPAAPLVAQLLGIVVAEQRQRDVLLRLVKLSTEWIEANQELIRKRIAGELPPWMPRIVDQKIYERLLDSARKMLAELSANPDHPLYEQFTRTLDTWIVNLQYDEDVRLRGEALKQELLRHPRLREIAGHLWQDVKANLLMQSATPGSALRLSIARGLSHVGDVLERDPEWRARVEGWVGELVHYLVSRYGRAAGDFVTQTVRSWDTAEVTRKVELGLGRDLQFIRINGTLVGGLVGLGIYTFSLLLPH